MQASRRIAHRLKQARLRTGLSQRALGIASGIEESVASARMNQYERGKHTPAPLILERIAEALRIPAAFFHAKDDGLAELIRYYGQLSADGREKTIETARQLAQAENTKKIVPQKRNVSVREKVPPHRRSR